jgi:hypothetical protein
MYNFEDFYNESNLNKIFYRKFKKYYKNESELNRETGLIKLVELMLKTNLEPYASASFKRNLARSVEIIKKSDDLESLIIEWSTNLNV